MQAHVSLRVNRVSTVDKIHPNAIISQDPKYPILLTLNQGIEATYSFFLKYLICYISIINHSYITNDHICPFHQCAYLLSTHDWIFAFLGYSHILSQSYWMSSLYRSTLHTIDDCKSSLNNFGAKLLKPRQRNFSNTRLQQYNPQEQIKLSQECPIQSQKQLFDQSGDIKKYCFNRFKSIDKFQGLRKNSSLKAIVKDQSQRNNLTKPEQLIRESLPDHIEASIKCDKAMTISIKRRVELIKKNQNRLKLNAVTKEVIVAKDAPRSNISLGQGLKSVDQPVKIDSNQKIRSQNYLGEGLKKSSSSKMKILVKNPFQKFMRQQESKFTQVTPRIEYRESISEEIDLKQSQILAKLQESYTSFAYRCELEQMLAMM